MLGPILQLHRGTGSQHSRPRKQKQQHPTGPHTYPASGSLHPGPIPTQPAEAPAAQSHRTPQTPGTRYCAICTPPGTICPNEYPMSSDWNEDLEEEERKNQEIKDHKDSEGKTPQNSPKFLSATTFTPQTPESSIKQFTKKSSETPTNERKQM